MTDASMKYRPFGSTGLQVSERAFGAMGIGGSDGAAVDRSQALAALARAEELGCNLVDTAAVYGDSEAIVGEFLTGRRERWILSSKYSWQPRGMDGWRAGDIGTLLDEQLRRLRTDRIDFYQLHSPPLRHHEDDAYGELLQLKQQGKIRFAGVSLKSAKAIDDLLGRPGIDGFQIPFGLLNPSPFLARRDAMQARRPAVLVRSVLGDGFLTGRYGEDAVFPDPADPRHGWEPDRIRSAVRQAAAFRFLEQPAGSMLAAAIAYPLSYPEVSSVLINTKSPEQAGTTFGGNVPGPFSPDQLRSVDQIQRRLGLYPTPRLIRLWRRITG